MVGIDIVKISKVQSLLKKSNFFQRFFTDGEIEYIENKNRSHQTIAGLIACKEAILKAFKLGFGAGLTFKDLEILHGDYPYLNTDRDKLKTYLDENNIINLDISISHDGEYAIAICTYQRGKNE
ncbi:holo-ACP synthase [Peptoniphilaceae bacterium SGI.131]